MSWVARCADCGRASSRTSKDVASRWTREHRCHRLSEIEADHLASLGAALAFTPDLGWHLLDPAVAERIVALAEAS